tara:strand:+ start:3974 stop:4582 length:609 start_codon:yes stop_codon:yes gene_type:complete
MKFHVLIGANTEEGWIQTHDKTFGMLPLLGAHPEFDGIWKVEYDDTTGAVHNHVELTPLHLIADNTKPTRAETLSDDEIVWWKNYVTTEVARLDQEKQAEAAALSRANDQELVDKYSTWNVNNKRTRDSLLINSDAYEMLTHLQSTGWHDWRQWLRDLPTTDPDVLSITFRDPPANANAMVLKSLNNWKQRLEVTKTAKENL